MSMEAASIAQHCQTLRLGAIGAQFASLAEEAKQTESLPSPLPRSAAPGRGRGAGTALD